MKRSKKIDMNEKLRYNRRRFLGAAAITIAAVDLFANGVATAQSGNTFSNIDVMNNSFGPLKQIDAGVLNIGYAEAGPASGTPVILLHG